METTGFLEPNGSCFSTNLDSQNGGSQQIVMNTMIESVKNHPINEETAKLDPPFGCQISVPRSVFGG